MENLFFAQNRLYMQPCAVATNVHPYWAENSIHYGVDWFKLQIWPSGFLTPSDVRTAKHQTAAFWTQTVDPLDANLNIIFQLHYNEGSVDMGTAGMNYGYNIKPCRDATETERMYFDGELIKGAYLDGSGFLNDAVKIGNLIWMVDFLNVVNYQNGTTIPNGTLEWVGLNLPAFSFILSNDYGRFYNGYAVRTGNLVSGNGWRIPTLEDCNALMNIAYGIGNSIYGNPNYSEAAILKSCRQINHPLA